jgi:hypothetical protein
MGLTTITFIHAENQLREEAGASLAAAEERIVKVVAELTLQVAAH